MRHQLDLATGEVGATVRRGRKWHRLLEDFRRGEGLGVVHARMPISLCVCSTDGEQHNIVGQGLVQDAYLTQFRNIPARMIRNEHENASRSYDGLLASMRRGYGDNFSEDELITVLVYLRTA